MPAARKRQPASKAITPTAGTTSATPAPKPVKAPSKPKDRVMALELRRVPIADLHEHPRNKEVRNHPEPGSAEWLVLETSLDHDYFDPLVWNKRNGQLVSGHLRRKVMESMGVTHADVIVVDYDEPTHLARLLAANNLLGKDDKRGMKVFLSELQSTAKFKMDLTGFTPGDLKSKFKLDPPSMNTGTPPAQGTGDGTSKGQYSAPGDSVPLALTFSPTDHIEVMSLLRTLRKTIAEREKRPLATVSNSEAVFHALLQCEG
jgi:hypothetical protein